MTRPRSSSRQAVRWHFDCHTCSEPAPESPVNEDFAAADPATGVFVVADGMGGRPAGNLASQLAACAFVKSVLAHPRDKRLRRSVLLQAVARANTAVRACGRRNVSRAGMGSTLSAAVLSGRTGRVVHLGDSRIYLYRKGRVRQLTQDHTLIEELLRRRCVNREEAARHPFRHLLLRAVGLRGPVAPDIRAFTLDPGDGLILTTDEFSRLLPARELERLAQKHWAGGARTVCEQLLRRARKRHPQDDLTVMVLRGVAGRPASP